MKVAVSIPDKVFQAAEQEARRLCISRSQFYAKALEHVLDIKKQEEDEVTANLNEVYAEPDTSNDEFLREAARRVFAANEYEW